MSNIKQRFERSQIYPSYRAMITSTKTRIETTVFDFILQQMIITGKVEKNGGRVRLAASGNVVGM